MESSIVLKPRKRQRVIDLVQQSGVDVSDWANYANGHENPGANPKYCYEWAFVEPGVTVVLNLWYDNLREENGTVENIDQLFAAAKATGMPVFISPHYYFEHDHRWQFEGTTLTQLPFVVAGDPWPIYSSKEIQADEAGDWEVSILGEDGTVLASESFRVGVEAP